jgi:hypothetical protein
VSGEISPGAAAMMVALVEPGATEQDLEALMAEVRELDGEIAP